MNSTPPKPGTYKCPTCGYIYDPDKGDVMESIPTGTQFIDLPDNWECPVCGTEKHRFKENI